MLLLGLSVSGLLFRQQKWHAILAVVWFALLVSHMALIGPHLGRSAANNIGYMCAGVYNALPRLADGHLDPKTGECTTLSTVIEFAAVPAFVIKPEKIAQASSRH